MQLNMTKILLGLVVAAIRTQKRESHCLPERDTGEFTTYLTFLFPQWHSISITGKSKESHLWELRGKIREDKIRENI